MRIAQKDVLFGLCSLQVAVFVRGYARTTPGGMCWFGLTDDVFCCYYGCHDALDFCRILMLAGYCGPFDFAPVTQTKIKSKTCIKHSTELGVYGCMGQSQVLSEITAQAPLFTLLFPTP